MLDYRGSIVSSLTSTYTSPSLCNMSPHQEFLLLEYSVTSARIFFRADLTAKEEVQGKEGESIPSTNSCSTLHWPHVVFSG